MKKLRRLNISWLTLMLFSLVFIGCGGGGGGGGGAPAAGGGAGGGGGGGGGIIPAANNAPVLGAIGPRNTGEGVPLSFIVTGSDPDGDPVTLSATGLATLPGAMFDAATGAFAWTPAVGNAGVFDITFTASDGSLDASEMVTIDVAALTTALSESEAVGASGANDSTATASFLPSGFSASGDLSLAGDMDVWSFSATAGSIIEIEMLATRLDQQGWGAAATVPRLRLTDIDGTTVLLEHDQAAFFWGAHDLDIPRFRVPASGDYYISVTQNNPALQGGRYALNIKELMVGTLQFEAEASGTSGANDTSGTAEPILDGTMVGYHTDLSSDFYSFAVATPSLACFEVTAYRNGIADQTDFDYTDLEMNIYDIDGTTLIANQDNGYFFDPAVCFGIEVAGTYYVEVTNFFGAGDGEYYLDFDLKGATPGSGNGVVEVNPNDSPGTATPIAYGQVGSGSVDAGVGGDEADYYFFSGTAGDVVRIQQYDAANAQGASGGVAIAITAPPDGLTGLSDEFNGPAGLQVTRTILQQTGNHWVRVSSTAGAGTTTYRFSIDMEKAAAYETEPNNDIASAVALDAGGRAAGVIDVAGDVDVYSFTAERGKVVTVSIDAAQASLGMASDGYGDFSGHGSMLEPVLTIHDASGTMLSETSYDPMAALVTGESVTNGLATMGATFIAPADGTYTVTVAESRAGVASADHYYVIERE